MRAVLLAVAVTLASCGGSGGADVTNSRTDYVSVVMTESFEKGAAASDSLLGVTNRMEVMGRLSSVEADYCRGVLYGDKDNSRLEEYYYRKALRDDQLYLQNPLYYFRCVSNLMNLLASKNAYEESMKLTLAALERLESQEPWVQDFFRGSFEVNVGGCQLETGLTKEAMASFRRACDHVRAEWQADTTSITRLDNWLTAMINTALSLSGKEGLDYGPWIDEAWEACRLFEEKFGDHGERLDDYKSCLWSLSAAYYAERGQADEAATAFRHYLATRRGQSPDAVFDRFDYYRKARLWEDAADLIPGIVAFLNDHETAPSLANLSILSDCYRIARRTGRAKEGAALADTIARLVDRVRQYHQQEDAAELGIIYDTEQKDDQINRLQWQKRRQQGAIVAVFLSIFILFLFTYMWFRRLAAHKLKAAYAQLEQRNADLQIANQKAEESSRMKTKFIQQISHEIRTPLNILSGFTQIITTPGMELADEEKLDINRRITDNTDRITQLVNKMLELSEASAQTVIERRDWVTAAGIAAQAVEVSGISRARHLDFTLSVDFAAGKTMLQTNLRFAVEALAMLLDNAKKFTHEPCDSDNLAGQDSGHKEKARLTVSAADGVVLFAVEDTGCGVPPSEAGHIFEEFVQLNEFYEGTGIGLSVARSIVRRLGGDITLDTSYTGGARFVMTLADDNNNDNNNN